MRSRRVGSESGRGLAAGAASSGIVTGETLARTAPRGARTLFGAGAGGDGSKSAGPGLTCGLGGGGTTGGAWPTAEREALPRTVSTSNVRFR
jgi:hypothetical protein